MVAHLSRSVKHSQSYRGLSNINAESMKESLSMQKKPGRVSLRMFCPESNVGQAAGPCGFTVAHPRPRCVVARCGVAHV